MQNPEIPQDQCFAHAMPKRAEGVGYVAVRETVDWSVDARECGPLANARNAFQAYARGRGLDLLELRGILRGWANDRHSEWRRILEATAGAQELARIERAAELLVGLARGYRTLDEREGLSVMYQTVDEELQLAQKQDPQEFDENTKAWTRRFYGMLNGNENLLGITFEAAAAAALRLSRHKPLTPLTGEDSEWMECGNNTYQNRRDGSVFKGLDENGQPYCHDIDAGIKVYPDGTEASYAVPVTFPYMPAERGVRVLCDAEGNILPSVAPARVLGDDLDGLSWEELLALADQVKHQQERRKCLALRRINAKKLRKLGPQEDPLCVFPVYHITEGVGDRVDVLRVDEVCRGDTLGTRYVVWDAVFSGRVLLVAREDLWVPLEEPHGG